MFSDKEAGLTGLHFTSYSGKRWRRCCISIFDKLVQSGNNHLSFLTHNFEHTPDFKQEDIFHSKLLNYFHQYDKLFCVHPGLS